MNYQNKNSKNKRLGKKSPTRKVIIVVSLILISAILFLFISRFWPSSNSEVTDVSQEPKTTSTSPTAQEEYTDGNDRPIQETNPDKGDVIVSDNQGSIPQISDESNWTSSTTGQITLYSPSQNQLIKNGDLITGESSLLVVSFRVIDDISGVISTGQLSVINGKFSGGINFSTTASGGRLDIFGTKEDGGEFSNIEVPVRFK